MPEAPHFSSSLGRFKLAQDHPAAGIATALAELRRGRKTSHWIWYVFPQLAGLGHSALAEQLAQGARLSFVMDSEIDCRKLVSSLTLFDLAIAACERADPKCAFLDLARDCAAMLAAADREGYPACPFTRTSVAVRSAE